MSPPVRFVPHFTILVIAFMEDYSGARMRLGKLQPGKLLLLPMIQLKTLATPRARKLGITR